MNILRKLKKAKNFFAKSLMLMASRGETDLIGQLNLKSVIQKNGKKR